MHHIMSVRQELYLKILKLLFWEIDQRSFHLSLRLIQWPNKCFSGSDFSTEIVLQTVMLQFSAVLTIHVAVIVFFSPMVVPYLAYFFLYSFDLCHKCTRTGSPSGCLRSETLSVISKALPYCHFIEF